MMTVIRIPILFSNSFFLLTLLHALVALRPASNSYQNPVLDLDFPDPSVVRSLSDGSFFAVATIGNSVNVQLAHSRDLVNWAYLGDALPK